MIHSGDCLEVMAGMADASVDAVVTDPPYGLEFMGKRWDAFKSPGRGARVRKERAAEMTPDGQGHSTSKGPFLAAGVDQYIAGTPYQQWCQAWGREALRVTVPGGYLLAFGGTRTHHRLVCGLEDAGWIIRDELDWIYACLSDDTEILTDLGWVPYNRANAAKLAVAFDPTTGKLRWEPISKIHRYDHYGPMVEVGPSLVTLNHRVILDATTACVPCLPSLWLELPETVGMDQESQRAIVLSGVQREAEAGGPTIQDWDTGRLDRGVVGVLSPENERPEQSGLEGRRYRVQEARELLWGSIRARTGVGEADGPARRLRDGASATARRALRVLARAFGMREPREPRPYRQSSRELDALAGQSDPQVVRVGEGHRGHGLPPGDTPRLVDYAGVVWCITVPSGAFVARRGGVAFVTGNSGFPKGRANLKPAHEPIVLARKPGPLRMLNIDGCRIGTDDEISLHGRKATDNGWDPRWSNAQTPQQTDGQKLGRWPANVVLTDPIFDGGVDGVVGGGAQDSRRWAEVDGQLPDNPGWGSIGSRSGDTYGDSGTYSRFFLIPKADRADREPVLRGQLAVSYAGIGHAATLDGEYQEFVNPAPKGIGVWLREQREAAGLQQKEVAAHFPSKTGGLTGCVANWELELNRPTPEQWRTLREVIGFDDRHDEAMTTVTMAKRERFKPNGNMPPVVRRENTHATVKPIELMRHLVRLVTPPGGTVLDPFLGSGTTAIACEMEGFAWVGIEKEAEYVAIAKARLNGVQRGLGLPA